MERVASASTRKWKKEKLAQRLDVVINLHFFQ
jgi:hypothetical protein